MVIEDYIGLRVLDIILIIRRISLGYIIKTGLGFGYYLY